MPLQVPVLRGRCGWLALLVLVSSSAAAGEPTSDPANPRLELVHADEMGDGFQLRSVDYLLDGVNLGPLKASSIAPGTQQMLFEGTLAPGIHRFSVRLVYEGRSAVFKYVEKYRFVMRARVTMDARPGYVIQVKTSARERSDLTLPWQQRPTFLLEGFPRRALLDVEADPVDLKKLEEGEDAALAPLPSEVPAPDDAGEPLPPDDAGEPSPPDDAAEPPASAPAPAPLTCKAEPVHFDFAKAHLRPDGEATLAALARCVSAQPALRLRVEGHCDVRGSNGYNLALGQGRAQAVASYLERQGIPLERMELTSHGEESPLCTEDSEPCHARNRRVVIVFLQDAPADER